MPRKPTRLAVDMVDQLTLSQVEPMIPLDEHGQRAWDRLIEDTPFWWSTSDINYICQYCALFDDIARARAAIRAEGEIMQSMNGSPVRNPASVTLAQLMKEFRFYSDELGLTSRARAKLKLTEATSSATRARVEDLTGKSAKEAMADVIDVDELMED